MFIVNKSSNWIGYFEELKLEINKALKGLDFCIELIDSTSVPLLATKPIIDIDIIYQTGSEFEKIKSGLLKAGYYHNGDQGISNREVFKRKGNSTNRILDGIPHRLHVCHIKSKALNRHVLFRNHLKKYDSARWEFLTQLLRKYCFYITS